MGYPKPALEGKSHARKKRPPSLLIESQQTAHYDDEAVAWPPRSEEIPVHRTFIDFGSLTRTPPGSPFLTVSTAPAVMSFSVKNALDAWETVSDACQCDGRCTITAGPPSSTASSTRVSEFTTLQESEQGVTELPESVTSTKASGFWQSTPCSTPRSLSESSQPTDPSALLYTDLCREPLTGQLPATGVEAPYQEHAPPLLPFNAYYRGNFASCHSVIAISSAFPANARKAAQTSQTIAKTSAQTQAQSSGEVITVSAQSQAAKDPAEVASQVREDDAEDESSDDGSSSDDDLCLCPKYSENVPLPSIGSSGHSEGTCKRCCFFPKGRCNNGYDCQFCHFAHEKRKSKMKKKKKRRKKRQTAGQSADCPTAIKNAQLQQAHCSASPSVQQLFGSGSCWTQTPPQHPPQRPSQLIVQGLQYVPATVPPNPVTMPMIQVEPNVWRLSETVHWW